MRKKFTPKHKAAIALEAIKGQRTINQLSSAYSVHATQIHAWKKQLQEGLVDLFADRRKRENKTDERLIQELYQIIGKRDTELEWLKKNLQPFGPIDKIRTG